MAKKAKRTPDDAIAQVFNPPAPKKTKAEPAPVKKIKATFHLLPETVERLRDASYWTPGAAPSLLAEDAILAYIAKLEKQRGEPFPPRKGALPRGRPVR